MQPNEPTNGDTPNDEAQRPSPAPPSRRRRWFRRLSIFLSIIVVLLVALQLTVQYYSNEIIGSALNRFVAYKSQGLYDFRYDDSSISLIKGSIEISGFHLTVDSARLRALQAQGRSFRYLYQAEIPFFQWQLASPKELLLKRSLVVESLNIVQPGITLHSFKREQPVNAKVNDFFDVISGYLTDFRIQEFYLTEGELHVRHTANPELPPDQYDVENININIGNITIDSTTRAKSGKPLRLEDFRLSTEKTYISLPRNSYSIALKAFQVSSTERFMEVDSFLLAYQEMPGLPEKGLRHLEFQKLYATNLDFPCAYFDSTFKADLIEISQPVVHVKPKAGSAPADSTPQYALFSAVRNVFKKVTIKEIVADSAAIDILGSPNQLQNFSLALYGFDFDDLNYQQRADKFFSDDMAFNIRNFQAALPDRIHQLKLREAGFSTRDGTFFTNNLLISPRMDGGELQRLSEAQKDKLTQVYCTRIAASGVDIWKLYLNKELDAQSLKISGPEININRYLSLNEHLRILQEQDALSQALAQQLDSVGPAPLPDSLALSDSLLLETPTDTLPGLLHEADSILSDTASVFVESVTDRLGPSPPDSAFLEETAGIIPYPPLLLPVTLPDLSWLEALLKPRRWTPRTDTLFNKKLVAALYGTLKQNIRKADIQQVELTEGMFNWLEKAPTSTRELFRVQGVSLDLQQFRLSESSAQATDRVLMSRHAGLAFDTLRYHLPDSLHKVEVTDLTLSSRDSTLQTGTLRFVPTEEGFYFIKSKAVAHKNVFKIEAEGFSMQGFDLRKLFNEQQIHSRQASLQSPNVVHFMGSRPQTPDSVQFPAIMSELETEIPSPKLYPLLRGLTLHDLNVQGGQYTLAAIKNFTETVFRARDISVCGRYLTLDTLQLKHNSAKLNLEDLEVLAEDYVYYLPDQVHYLEVAELGISVSDSAIYAYDLTISPRPWLRLKDSSNIYNLHIPEARVDYIDLMEIYYEQNAIARQVQFTAPQGNIRLFNSTIIEKKAQQKRVKLENLYELIAGTLDTLQIDTFRITSGGLDLVNTRGDRVHYVQSDRIEVLGKGFFLDESSELEAERFLYADDISITIGNYYHKFPDEWHSVRLSEMGYSTDKNAFYAEFVHYAPNNWASNNFMERRADAKNSYDVYTPRVEASGIGLYGLYMHDSLGVGRVHVEAPQLRFVNHWQPKKRQAAPKKFSTDSLYSILNPVFQDFNIGELALDQVYLELMVYQPQDSTYLKFEEVDLLVDHFEVDSASHGQDPRFLHADNFRISLKDIAFDLPDSLYTCKMDEVGFATGEETFFVHGVDLKPRYAKADIAEITGVETDWMHFEMDTVNLRGLDFYELVNHEKVLIDNAIFNGFNAYVYRDKRPPMPMNHFPPLPQEFIKSLGFYLKVDSLTMYNSNAVYEELSIGAANPGRISFNDIRAQGLNITNDSAMVASGTPLLINAKALLMGEGDLAVDFSFNLGSPDNAFSYEGNLGPMDMTLLNLMLEDVAGVKINSGYNQSLNMMVQADDDHAEGVMRFRYNDLNVTLIDQETKKAGFLRGITSLFANFLVVKSDNPRFLFLKKGKIYTPRPENKSVFNYMAKTALSGLKHSVGLSNEKPEKEHRKSVFDLWREWTGQDYKRRR